MPALQTACVDSWKHHCPDYKLVFWNEENIPSIPLVNRLIKKRHFAFASDYIRLWVLYNYGGFYLDTDIELIKSLDAMRCVGSFVCEESPGRPTNAAAAALKGEEYFLRCSEFMEYSFLEEKRILYSPEVTREVLRTDPNGVRVLDSDYFYPFNPYVQEIKGLMFRDITERTVGIYHYSGSWKLSILERLRRLL